MKDVVFGEIPQQGSFLATFSRQGCLWDRLRSVNRSCRRAIQRPSGMWMLVSQLMICLFVFTANAAEEEKIPDWRRLAPIASKKKRDGSTGEASSQVEVGRVVAIIGNDKEKKVNEVTILRPSPDGETLTVIPQVEDKVYVGDLLEVKDSSAIELTFGHNARLRIGSGSLLKIVSIARIKMKDTEQTVTKRDVELKKGIARVRVKKNIKSPSPVLILFGNAKLILERSDAVVERKDANATIMVLKGKAEVEMRNLKKGIWEFNKPIRVSSAEKLTIPVVKAGSSATLMEVEEIQRLQRIFEAKPQKMSDGEQKQLEKGIQKSGKKPGIVFERDEAKNQLPPAPKVNPEMDEP